MMEQQAGNDSPQEVSTIQESSDASWKVYFKIFSRSRLLKHLLQWLHKGCSWLVCLFSVGVTDSHEQCLHSPERTVRRAKKRLGIVARVLFAFIPSRLQLALGFLNTMCQRVVLEETLKSPVRPSRKGNKRKQEDLVLEEHQCWIETLLEEFPDDDPEDPTYEPTKSETDSEEYKSQNDTDIDLEYEEKDGLLLLKEDPISLQGPSGEDSAAETPPTGDTPQGRAALQTGEDGSEHSERCLLISSGSCSTNCLESTETMARSIQGSDSSDSQEHWTEPSCPE